MLILERKVRVGGCAHSGVQDITDGQTGVQVTNAAWRLGGRDRGRVAVSGPRSAMDAVQVQVQEQCWSAANLFRACRRAAGKARQGKARQGRARGAGGAFAAWDEGEEEDRDGA
jgi:hypothetical protein